MGARKALEPFFTFLAKTVPMSNLFTSADQHLFDRAMAMAPAGTNQFTTRASKDYWNMVGPYGGITAAQMAQAVSNETRPRAGSKRMRRRLCMSGRCMGSRRAGAVGRDEPGNRREKPCSDRG